MSRSSVRKQRDEGAFSNKLQSSLAFQQGQILINRTSYVRKELFTLLDAEQRDQFVKEIYSMLFAFIVETCNHRLAPNAKDAPHLPKSFLSINQASKRVNQQEPHRSLCPAISPLLPQNGFDEFFNPSAELLQSRYIKHTFETIGYNGQIFWDSVSLPEISTMGNRSCVELSRGALISERAQRKLGGLLGINNNACSSFKSGRDGDSRNEDLIQELSS